jgi:hypothetical protein
LLARATLGSCRAIPQRLAWIAIIASRAVTPKPLNFNVVQNYEKFDVRTGTYPPTVGWPKGAAMLDQDLTSAQSLT